MTDTPNSKLAFSPTHKSVGAFSWPQEVSPLVIVAALLAVVLVLLAIFAPVIAPFEPDQQKLLARLRPRSDSNAPIRRTGSAPTNSAATCCRAAFMASG